MARRKKAGRQLYTTKEAANFLGVDQWRVKNFSEGEAYGLPPTVRAGRGRGSRRLYEKSDVYRMLIANELVSFGFTPEAIGKAVREIAESKLIQRDYFDPDCEVLVQHRSGWRVLARSLLSSLSKRNTLIVVPFQQLILDREHEIRRSKDDKFMRREFPEVWKEENPEG